MIDYTQLKFESNHQIDKIVLPPISGQIIVPGFNMATFEAGTVTQSITHNIGRKCLPELIWTTDGVNYYDAGMELDTGVGVAAACGENTVTIYGYNNITTFSTNVSYILYLLWP